MLEAWGITLPQYFSVNVDPGIAKRIERLYDANRWAWSSKRALYHDLLRRGLLVLERDMARTRYALSHLYDQPARKTDSVNRKTVVALTRGLDLHAAWTPEDDAIALRMRTEKRPFSAIANELDRSVYAVKARLRKLGSR